MKGRLGIFPPVTKSTDLWLAFHNVNVWSHDRNSGNFFKGFIIIIIIACLKDVRKSPVDERIKIQLGENIIRRTKIFNS